MILVFSIQTIIQLVAMLSPEFNDFTDLFKTERIVELKKQYLGIRLNAISGAPGFSLACGYGILIDIVILRWNELKFKNYYVKILLFMCLVLGGLIAGRTSLIFDALGIIFLLYKKIMNLNFKLNITENFSRNLHLYL